MCSMRGRPIRYLQRVRKEALDRAVLRAHERGDGAELARLYADAGDLAEMSGRIDEACFFWVQSYVFALEAGLPIAEQVRGKLKRFGREA